MSKNAKLNRANRNKDDEFYTSMEIIEKEIGVYVDKNPSIFVGKTVYCPCDDYSWSNFAKYFADNFTKFGLKKLVTTCYQKPPTLFDDEKSGLGKIMVIDKSSFIPHTRNLTGDGDFRSNEVERYWDEADFVITNPPFSLFNEFVRKATLHDVKFLLIGSLSAVGYKDVFSLIKNNKAWLGNYPASGKYTRPNGTVQIIPTIANVWYTNIDRVINPPFVRTKSMEENLKNNTRIKNSNVAYKKYDNYDAIEIPFSNSIPSGYGGEMGVPISFLTKYNPDQFEIVGSDIEMSGKGFTIDNKPVYKRILIKAKPQL